MQTEIIINVVGAAAVKASFKELTDYARDWAYRELRQQMVAARVETIVIEFTWKKSKNARVNITKSQEAPTAPVYIFVTIYNDGQHYNAAIYHMGYALVAARMMVRHFKRTKLVREIIETGAGLFVTQFKGSKSYTARPEPVATPKVSPYAGMQPGQVAYQVLTGSVKSSDLSVVPNFEQYRHLIETEMQVVRSLGITRPYVFQFQMKPTQGRRGLCHYNTDEPVVITINLYNKTPDKVKIAVEHLDGTKSTKTKKLRSTITLRDLDTITLIIRHEIGHSIQFEFFPADMAVKHQQKEAFADAYAQYRGSSINDRDFDFKPSPDYRFWMKVQTRRIEAEFTRRLVNPKPLVTPIN